MPRKKTDKKRLAEAQAILEALGLPAKQQTVLAARILVGLAGITLTHPWSAASRRTIGIHDLIAHIASFSTRYAENTRETFRKSVLRPFEQARIIDKNPDDPARPPNSKHNKYCLTEDVLPILRAWGTADFDEKVAEFKSKHKTLLEVYLAARRAHRVPIITPAGETIILSPGKHNRLQKAVIEQFGPRFAPGAQLLYLGDAEKKEAKIEKPALAELGISYSVHEKFPDIILHLESRGWVYLIEAVTSHGPISHSRKVELKGLLAKCESKPIFVTAFLEFRDFKRFAADLAWETEVWIAELPDHMIHYNGEKFLGPTPEGEAAEAPDD